MNKELQFNDLGLSKDLLYAISQKGFKSPSEIQAKIIPLVLEHKHDIIGISQTGSGKTGSFGLPLLDTINLKSKGVKAIILAPTRELALQITKEIDSFKGRKRVRLLTVYGGSSINTQVQSLRRGIDIVVGTPGRVLDLINRRALNLLGISHFILDEADEMLKMGFIDDIETILEQTSHKKRVLLFSATMPERIKELSKKYMKKQTVVEVKPKLEYKDNIRHQFAIASREKKFPLLCKILNESSFFYGIVFCMTKKDVDEVTHKLKAKNYQANCIHGDITQSKREKILNMFRKQKINILVATDVAARGIDVNDLTHVINYSLPKEFDSYIHRAGRTGRAGKKGLAISFMPPRQKTFIKELEKIYDISFDEFETGKLKAEKNDMKFFDKKKSRKFLHNKDLKKKDNKKFDKKKWNKDFEKENKQNSQDKDKKKRDNKKKDFKNKNVDNDNKKGFKKNKFGDYKKVKKKNNNFKSNKKSSKKE